MINYYKYVDFKGLEEAPFEIVKDGKTIRGYNKPSNEAMLIDDGYIKYEGTKDKQHLDYVDGHIVEIEEVQPANTIFTKLQIRRAMRKMGIEGKLDEIISGNMEFQKDWQDAQEIDLNDDVFKLALTENGISDEFIQTIVSNIEEQ